MRKETGRKIITFDWAIKTVLRDKANFDVLEGFDRLLSSICWRVRATGLTTLTNTIMWIFWPRPTTAGERIIIEVQYLSEMAYLKRLAYGTAKIIVENLKLGDAYTHVRKVYSVSLLYFDATKDGDDYIYHGKTEFTGFHTHKPGP